MGGNAHREKVLVTGGLGMIGAFICRALIAKSRQPVIYDAGGHTGFIRDIAADCVIERGDICDMPRLMGVISRHKPAAIAHFAGHVGPTVEQFPWSSLNTNLMGTTTVFECAPQFDFRSAAIDYAQTLARLKAGDA